MSTHDGHIELERAVDSIHVGHRHRRDLGELDLLAASIERDGLLHPFEFKLTTKPDMHDASGLRAFKATYPERATGPGALVCAVTRPRWVTDEVLAIPWNLL